MRFHSSIRLSGPLVATSVVCAALTCEAGDPATRLLPFQARLADAAGRPIPDGATLMQFQIFNNPTNKDPVWAGEIHRTSVNRGLVNVMLGSKNPFPGNCTNELGAVFSFFDAPLYLEVTVDSAGKEDGSPDGKISNADIPLHPRQTLVPVLFAVDAARAREAGKLNGSDWSGILADGATDPQQVGARLKNSLIATNAVTSERIQDGAVSDAKLDPAVRNRIANLEARVADLERRLSQVSFDGENTYISLQPNPKHPDHNQYVAFQGDGNVVIRRDGNVKWSTGTSYP